MPNRDRILVVEDDRDSLAGLFTLLTHAGYSVLTAEDGAKAVDLLAHGIHPRLIVLDLMMPKVSGWDVLKYLREDPQLRHRPVIVLTAHHDPQVVGADVVLSKPVVPTVLLAEIARLLNVVLE